MVKHPIVPRHDDGLPAPTIGPWGNQKLQLVRAFGGMFTTSMRRKWETLVYVDLFAGGGCSRIRGTEIRIPGSPLVALGLNPPFDRHVLCERDHELMTALRTRVSREHPSLDVRFIEGDVNSAVDAILVQLPAPSRDNRALAFCVVDPFKLRNLRFDTLRQLSSRFMDFFVLVPTHMDANRNWMNYLRPGSMVITEFLGNPTWREDWGIAADRNEPIGNFLTNALGRSMEGLGYRYGGVESTVLIRSDDRNLPLYRLALFSRHELGEKFWAQARKYNKEQAELGLYD
jgi:three-Cys-motif partner protein